MRVRRCPKKNMAPKKIKIMRVRRSPKKHAPEKNQNYARARMSEKTWLWKTSAVGSRYKMYAVRAPGVRPPSAGPDIARRRYR
jgi:hypothetical protein